MTQSRAEEIAFQRSRGRAYVCLRAAPSGGRLARLHQSGSAKAFVHQFDSGPEIVFLNTSGGLTTDDRLDLSLDLAANVRASATTQTAERIYHQTGGPARVQVTHVLGRQAHLDWLPQETILFDHGNLQRDTTITLAAGASCLMLESLVLGRAAMGETLARINLRDTRRILREGQPVFVEPLRMDSAALGAGAAVFAGHRAMATLALIAQGAEDALSRVRDVLDEPGVSAGASALDGKLIVRLMAADGWPLRRQTIRILDILRPGPLPRIWQI